MYQFNLSRKKVTSTDDSSLLGYNYYLIGIKDGDEKNKELIYSTIGLPEPLDLSIHDSKAANLYDNFMANKIKLSKMPSLKMVY